jgi:indolepyruvate ferredoxin oxidoreductase alpha subunit
MFKNILEKSNKPRSRTSSLRGESVMLLGNEAIVRGALESGVGFVSTYPGTPASEIGNNLYLIQRSSQKIKNLHFEFSTNEKVALEAGAGACFSGLRTLVAMKNFGLNVASDFLLPLVYTGVKAGMVILVADDPNCWSSAQSEENTRAFAQLANIPILEPSDPQECKDFVKYAFEMSEKFKIPVIIRETTRVAHQSSPVKLSAIDDRLRLSNSKKAKFVKDTHQFVTMPPRVLEMHKELLEKIQKIKQFSEKSNINKVQNSKFKIQSSKVGVVTSGVSYLYVMDAMKELNINLPVLKLGFFHPLPTDKISSFVKGMDKVLVVEELEPYLEREITILAKEVNPKLKIIGKELLPEVGERRIKARNSFECYRKIYK